jgi:hypothetical protein
MKRLSIVVGGRRNRHRDRNRDRVLQADNFDSDRDPDSDADILDCSFLFSEQACSENGRSGSLLGRAKARPHCILLSEISSGHGLQPVRFFVRLGAPPAHGGLSRNSLVTSKCRISRSDLDLDLDVDSDCLVRPKLSRDGFWQIALYPFMSTSKSTPGPTSRTDDYGVWRQKPDKPPGGDEDF